MTAEEVEKVSRRSPSPEQRSSLANTSQNAEDQIIGHFRLGLLAHGFDKIDQYPLTRKMLRLFRSCDGGSDIPRSRIAHHPWIDITVDKESEEFLEESKIREICRYCSFTLSDLLNGEKINDRDLLDEARFRVLR
jgi:hypothetical protein